MRVTFIIIILSLVVSCSFDKNQKGDSNRKIHREYYDNNNLKSECEQVEVINDSVKKTYCKKYYENGKLYSAGNYINDNPINWHKFYRDDSTMYKLIEYVIVGDKNNQDSAFINQVINFKENGDTNYLTSNFYRILSNYDTILLGDEYKANIELTVPYFKNSKIYFLIEIPDDSTKLRRLFSGSNIVKYDYLPKDTGIFDYNGVIREIDDSVIPTNQKTITKCREMQFNLKYYVQPR